MDVRGHRPRPRRPQGLPRPGAKRPAWRAFRPRRPAPLPRLAGVGLLHRAHPLRRRRIYGGVAMPKPRIAVIGAGLMGHGIAQVFGLAGHDVAITDSHAPTLATAKDRIFTNLKDLGGDLA